MAEIEYFYSSYSAYAYLGSARFMEIARAAGRRIVHRPVNLRPVVAQSGSLAFGKRAPTQLAYYFGREVERWAEHRGIAVMNRRPTHHDNDTNLCDGMIIAGLRVGLDMDALAHAILAAHWCDDADFADRQTLADLGRGVGLDPEPLLDAALSPDVQAVYEANPKEAVERSVLGSPTYFVDGDMFYGQDHLEMVERACVKPYANTWGK
jgi:2-hydroxychromene-2-carboxylate isomerase